MRLSLVEQLNLPGANFCGDRGNTEIYIWMDTCLSISINEAEGKKLFLHPNAY